MKIQTIFLTLVALFVTTQTLTAQSMSKPYKTIKVERHIDAPAERVWNALVLDYGKISDFSPFIYASNYENGSLKGKEGAERKCLFNEKGTQWSHERIAEIDSDAMTMKNIIVDAQKFPIDPDNSYAVYSVRDNGDGSSTAGYTFHFRATPAFLGGLMKGAFTKSLNETLIGLEHHLTTGERVTGGSENAKAVVKAYKKSGDYGDYETR